MIMLGSHHDHDHSHDHHHGHSHTDHNLRAAYLHVLADALTSLLAIFALLAGKFLGLNWMDPAMGIVGAILVALWSVGLIRDTGGILLDHQAPAAVQEKARIAIEAIDDNRIADLHIWSIGPNIYSATFSIVSDSPKPPEHYKSLIPKDLGIVHPVVEVHRCR
jgi:cation diffusion facilitator family transporter